jgi:hypothetical protein
MLRAGRFQLIDYNTQDYEAEVKRLTGGRGGHRARRDGRLSLEEGLSLPGTNGTLVMFGLSNAATGKTARSRRC